MIWEAGPAVFTQNVLINLFQFHLAPFRLFCTYIFRKFKADNIVKGLKPGAISKVGWVWSSGRNVVLNRTVVVHSDWRFDNLCGSHLQSQSELYHVSWWYYTLVIDLIGQLCRDVIDRLSVKSWCNDERTTGELTIWLTIDDCLTVTIDRLKRTSYWLRVFIANNITA